MKPFGAIFNVDYGYVTSVKKIEKGWHANKL